jgi:hypothetical protein
VQFARNSWGELALRLRGTRVLLLTLAVAGALLGLMLVSRDANAWGVNYCVNWISSGSRCEGPYHSLTANIAYDGTGSGSYVCEAATDAAGNSVGGWACGYGYAESCFAGNQLLHGWLANASPYWLFMYGTEYYSQGCP